MALRERLIRENIPGPGSSGNGDGNGNGQPTLQEMKSRLHRGRLILRKQLADFAGGLTMHRPIYGT